MGPSIREFDRGGDINKWVGRDNDHGRVNNRGRMGRRGGRRKVNVGGRDSNTPLEQEYKTRQGKFMDEE